MHSRHRHFLIPALALDHMFGYFAAANINVAYGQMQDPEIQLGYYGISWEVVAVNGISMFYQGKSQ